jgi:hypothetical protein
VFEYLQREYPGRFQDGQLRTLQRRVPAARKPVDFSLCGTSCATRSDMGFTDVHPSVVRGE